jgi:AcrR family transcriptional regulator
MMAVGQHQPARRTQAERRAATRAALLDATIASLVEEGYANTTTRGVAERAEVTPGALQHHFATKIELMAEARRRISTKIIEEVLAQGDLTGLPLLERSERLLDLMWELYTGPLFQAGMELWIAARTDAELRANLVEVQHMGGEFIAAVGPTVYPEVGEQIGVTELIATGDATLRGLAVLRFVNPQDADRVWPATRAYLLALGAPLRDEAEKSP